MHIYIEDCTSTLKSIKIHDSKGHALAESLCDIQITSTSQHRSNSYGEASSKKSIIIINVRGGAHPWQPH